MKFVKRISLFFIYPLSMFTVGFVSNMFLMEYFYPPSLNGSLQQTEEAEETEGFPVSLGAASVITANTRYIVQEYDRTENELTEQETVTPDKYIGLDRQSLWEEIEAYNEQPSLADQKQGFSYMELISFSPDKVVVRKSYEPEVAKKGFFLLNEDHHVVVYDQSLENVYMNTDILVEELSDKLQQEIIDMKYIESEGELYNFLESYSS